MRLDLLAKVLEEADLGVIGESIFLYRMSADTDQGIMLRLPLDGVPVDTALPDYYHHSVQIIARATNQATGDALIKSAVEALTIYNRVFENDDDEFQMKINHLFPRTLPRVYPRLDGQGIEWSVDLNSNYVMPR